MEDFLSPVDALEIQFSKNIFLMLSLQTLKCLKWMGSLSRKNC